MEAVHGQRADFSPRIALLDAHGRYSITCSPRAAQDTVRLRVGRQAAEIRTYRHADSE